MQAQNIDALLITAEANYFYFTGHRTHSPWSTFTRPHVAVLTRDGGATMIVHCFTRPEAESRSFVADVREYGSLVEDGAPRDVVARGIWRCQTAGHRVFLDARAAIGDAFPARFPTVFAACQAAGIDPRRQPIRVLN